MNKLRILSLIVLVVGFGLCLHWYGVKLLVVIMLVVWGNNLEEMVKREEDR